MIDCLWLDCFLDISLLFAVLVVELHDSLDTFSVQVDVKMFVW